VLAAASIHRDCEPELFKAMEDDQYRSWFAREYRGNYPTGLRVPAGPRCAIDIAAFPPSPGPSIYLRFGNEAEYDSNGGWATALLHLARKAYGDLKEFLASKAEGKADFALLPRDAVRELAPESYTALLSATLAAVHEKRVLRWRELFDFFGCAEPDAGRATRIASVLATIGRFMEPSPAELVDEYVAFYHAESTGGDSTNYRMAQEAVDYLMPRMRHHGRLVLEIATSIAAALRLSADHRARLLARGVWSFSRQTEPIGQPSDATRLLLGRLWSFAVEANHAWTKLEGASAALGRRLEKLLVTSAAPAPSQTSPQQARIPSRPAASVMVEVLPISRAQLQSALGAMDAARQLASAELQRPSTAYLSTVERSMLDQLLHRPFTIEQFRDLCRHHAIFVDAFADKINEVSLDLCRAEAIQTYPTFAVNLPALRAVTQGE
jgi:hypothetical protein